MSPDGGFSDTLGAIILIAVVAAGVALAGVALLSSPAARNYPSVEADLTILDHAMIIRHLGGDALNKGEVSFIISGNDTKHLFTAMDGSSWSRWSVGDSLRYDIPAGQSVPHSLLVVYHGGSSPRVILSLGEPRVELRVNCGGSDYTDTRNNYWSADQSYTPGGWGYGPNRNSYSTANPVSGTSDPRLYQTESWFSGGNGNYRFTVPEGDYKVSLKFAEIYSGINPANPRIFSVALEGEPVITDLSLLETAGMYAATDGTFYTTVNDGILDIDFIKGRENPKISAIEILSE
jgi:hypothetical protein